MKQSQHLNEQNPPNKSLKEGKNIPVDQKIEIYAADILYIICWIIMANT